ADDVQQFGREQRQPQRQRSALCHELLDRRTDQRRRARHGWRRRLQKRDYHWRQRCYADERSSEFDGEWHVQWQSNPVSVKEGGTMTEHMRVDVLYWLAFAAGQWLFILKRMALALRSPMNGVKTRKQYLLLNWDVLLIRSALEFVIIFYPYRHVDPNTIMA